MRKIIRSNLMKMVGVVLAIFGLAGWAHHFVWSGIVSNIYLNGAIIALLIFAVYLSFRNVFKLKNEIIAFEALQEVWEDIRNDEQRSAEDPYWRHYRTLNAGHVFSRPPLLGHIYELTYEELLRSRKLRISLETMQSLMHGIDSRLSGERSLINYLGGLLVFLGLIGTFIGLMEMVASVGGIIGALNNAGGGGDAMKQLLTDLQAPLTGMATGFSSSLFGLFGSLTVGLISRFGNRAADSLRDAFESWLAGVSQLENEDGVRHASGGVGGVVVADGGALIAGDPERGKNAARALESMARNMKLNTETMERVAKLMERMVAAQAEQRDFMDRTAAGLERLALQQADLPVQLGKIAANEGLRGDIVELSTVVYDRMRDGFSDVAASLVAVLEANSEQFQKLAGQQAEIMESMAVVAKISPLTDELRRIGMSLEKGVADGFTDVAKVFDLSSKTQTEAMRYLADHQTQMTGYMSRVVDGATSVSDMRKIGEGIEASVGQGLAKMAHAMERAAREQSEALARLATQGGVGSDPDVLRLELRALARSMETGMQDGFGELARAFEAAFVSYADLLQRSLADAPRAAAPRPAPEPEPEPAPVMTAPDAFADHEAMMLKLYSAAATQLTTKQA